MERICTIYFKERSEAAVSKGSQMKVKKARALWKMQAARHSGEDFYDPERKDDTSGRSL